MKGFDRNGGEDAIREALTALFADAGEVANVRLPTDRETGELKGFGFIEFADKAGKVCPPSPSRIPTDVLKHGDAQCGDRAALYMLCGIERIESSLNPLSIHPVWYK